MVLFLYLPEYCGQIEQNEHLYGQPNDVKRYVTGFGFVETL